MEPVKDNPVFSLPVTVGVVGHGRLATGHRARIEAAIASVLEDLRKKSSSSPIMLLTSLAGGADRLVARIAADRFGARIIAVLPRPAEALRRQFPSEEIRDEFDALVGRAGHVVVMDPHRDDAAGVPVSGDAVGREACDDRAGLWIALHAHLLIALWDGTDTGDGAAIARVVKAKQLGRYDGVNDSDPLQCEEAGAIAHVVTALTDAPASPDVGAVRWLYPDVAHLRSEKPAYGYNAALNAIGMVNTLCRRAGHTIMAWSDLETPALRRVGLAADVLPPISYSAALRAFASHFARHYQSQTSRTVVLLALATLAAGIASMLDTLIGSAASTIATIAILGAGYVAWAFAGWARWQHRHLELRALAEGGRVQLAWLACGLRLSVADQYNPAQMHAVGWIRRALRTAYVLDTIRLANRPAPADKVRQADAALAWIASQIHYFVGDTSVVLRFRRARRFFAVTGIGVLCLVVGTLIGATGQAMHFVQLGFATTDASLLLHAAKLILALASATMAYQASMAFRDMEQSFSTSAHLFKVANESARRAKDAGDYSKLAETVVMLGRAALVENTGWLLLKRRRLLKPPLA